MNRMSIFRSYTPKYLYESTLRMVNALFARPPTLELEPASYFRATLLAHEWMKNDLKGVVLAPDVVQGETTIVHVHHSLQILKKCCLEQNQSMKRPLKIVAYTQSH